MSLLDDTLASEDNLRLTEVDLLPEILSSWLFLASSQFVPLQVRTILVQHCSALLCSRHGQSSHIFVFYNIIIKLHHHDVTKDSVSKTMENGRE